MNNEVEREVKNSKNKFELEGNVANINDIYTNQILIFFPIVSSSFIRYDRCKR